MRNIERRAVYAGSFDPVTNGHLWIIEQIAHMFDSAIVAIGQNSSKQYTFSIDERKNLLKTVTAKFSNIEIADFENELLVNYAKRICANFIVRGIRNSADYEYEKSMRYVNSDLSQDVTTVFLIPPRNYAEVSSSLVKSLVGNTGWEQVVGKYISPSVMQALTKWNISKTNMLPNNVAPSTS